jgi:excisionase family DNA binding protein
MVIPEDKELLTVAETAGILRVKPDFVYRLCRNNELPVVRLGGRVMVSRVGLQKMIYGATPTPTTAPAKG